MSKKILITEEIPIVKYPDELLYIIDQENNQCFRNTILQNIFNIKNFFELIDRIVKDRGYYMIGDIVSHIHYLFFRTIQMNDEIENIFQIDFVSLNKIIYNSIDFIYGQPNDTYEFLMKLLELFEHYEGKNTKPLKFVLKTNDFKKYKKNTRELKYQKDNIEKHPFESLFTYYVKYITECHNCGERKATFEKHNVVKCCTSDNDITITNYFNSEFSGNNKSEHISDFICRNCKNRGTTYRKLFLSAIPQCFVINIIDHIYNVGMQKFEKKNTGKIKLEKYLRLRDGIRYRLNSIAVHSSGHYYAYCLKNNIWYFINDTQICEVDESAVLESPFYLAFYIFDDHN